VNEGNVKREKTKYGRNKYRGKVKLSLKGVIAPETSEFKWRCKGLKYGAILLNCKQRIK
jgi:hypothetical protein